MNQLLSPQDRLAGAASPRPISPARSGPISGWVACGLFIAVSLTIVWFGRNERSAWILMTAPQDAFMSNADVLSYCYLHGSNPFHKENAPSVLQVAFFSGMQGSESRLDFYVLRGYYGFFSTLLTPVGGVLGALQIVNWLAWVLCAWTTWLLSKKLFDDNLAALCAVVFTAGGTGMIFHIGDYSSHLLAFASYYLGVYLLYSSGVAFERQPLRTHLMLGAYLAVACLTYNTGVMLTAAYVLVSLRHNALRYLAAAALLALTARPLWQVTLHSLGANIADTEAHYLQTSLQLWHELWQQPWPTVVRHIGRLVSEFAFFDSPLVVALGLFSCFYLPSKPGQRWFGAVVLGVPLLASLVFANFAQARGYLIYGISMWLYCWLGWLLAVGLRGSRARRLAAGLGLGLLVASHFAWSTAHLWGQLGPVKTYFLGWGYGLPYFVHPRTEVASMTGFEETPVLFGGKTALAEAGPHVQAREQELDRGAVSFGMAFSRRLLLFAYLGLLVAFLTVHSWRRGVLVSAGVLGAALLSAGLSWVTFRAMPAVQDIDGAIVLPPGGSLTFRAVLVPSFLDKLASQTEQGDTLVFFIGTQPRWTSLERLATIEVSVTAGPTPIPLEVKRTRPLWHARDTSAAVRTLGEAGQVAVAVVNRTEEPLRITGWQRRDLKGRELVVAAPEGSWVEEPDVLPAVEIRLMRPDNSLKLHGF
jgi:hypothetical protein